MLMKTLSHRKTHTLVRNFCYHSRKTAQGKKTHGKSLEAGRPEVNSRLAGKTRTPSSKASQQLPAEVSFSPHIPAAVQAHSTHTVQLQKILKSVISKKGRAFYFSNHSACPKGTQIFTEKTAYHKDHTAEPLLWPLFHCGQPAHVPHLQLMPLISLLEGWSLPNKALQCVLQRV